MTFVALLQRRIDSRIGDCLARETFRREAREGAMGENIGGKLRALRRPRDENGWRIPLAGTKSRRIYDLIQSGKTLAEIAKILNSKYDTLGGLVHKMRHPGRHNVRNRIVRPPAP